MIVAPLPAHSPSLLPLRLKDWLLIMLSVVMYKSPVTRLQIAGYGLAFAGVCWYNYQKLHAAAAPGPTSPSPKTDEEKQPFISGTAKP